MKRIAAVLLTGIVLAVSSQAHAVLLPSDAITNRINSAFRTNSGLSGGTVTPHGIGNGGGATGTGGNLGPACSGSPENATILLALLSAAGLLAGQQIARKRILRTAPAQAL